MREPDLHLDDPERPSPEALQAALREALQAFNAAAAALARRGFQAVFQLTPASVERPTYDALHGPSHTPTIIRPARVTLERTYDHNPRPQEHE